MGTEVAGLSLRERVKAHVRERIARGELRRGARLPSILELARALRVSKNTVIGALDDLCGDGTLEARERTGFFVRRARASVRARRARLQDLRVDRVAHAMATILVSTGDEDFVPIGNGTTAESLLSTPEWTQALRHAQPRDPRAWLRYADPMGEPRLREVIAARLEVSPDDVMATCGAVEGLNLSFAAAAAHTGSRRIALESPGYFMMGPMLAEAGLEVVPIPRTRDALDLDALRAEAKKAPLAAVMVNPNHQNPTGGTLPLAQRFALAKIAEDFGFFIVEDDVYKGLWVEEAEPPSIRSLLPSRTLYVDSFSKTLGPALRIGFVVAPEVLREAVCRRKYLFSLSGDSYTQNLVADFVETRGYARHLEEVRGELARRARIARLESERFADLGRFEGPFTGGLFWRFHFRAGVDAMELYAAARAKNVLVSPGRFFRPENDVNGGHDAWMRVNVSRCDGALFTKALDRLRALCEC
jgi:DNA-binding transcriptional MocR family regulator